MSLVILPRTILSLILLPILAYAEEPPPAATSEINFQRIDRSKDWLANRVERLSEGIDNFFIERFFGEKILDDDVSGSRAVFSLYSRREFGGEVNYKFDARLKLVLPHTKDRLKLLVSSEDDSEYKVERDPVRNIENATYSTALRFILAEAKAWKSDVDVGMRLNLPFNPFVRARAYRYNEFLGWQSRVTQSVYFYHLDGWSEKTDAYMDYAFAEDKLLRLSGEAKYTLVNAYFDLNYGLGLYHRLKNNAVFAYLAGASGNTALGPTFKNYFAGVKYRRRIYQDWVYAEVTPQLEWSVDRNYQRMGVIMFRLEALVGSEN